MFYVLNTLLSKFLIKNKKSIVLYGRAMYDENQIALLNYLIDNKYNEKYKIYLVCTDENAVGAYRGIKNVFIIMSQVKGYIKTLTSKFVFFTHGRGKTAGKVPKGQKVFNLWHGTALKTLPCDTPDRFNKVFTYALCAGKFAEDYFRKLWKLREEQVYRGGYPRCDALFCGEGAFEKLGIEKNKYSKVVLYMPTYRKSKAIERIDSANDMNFINMTNICVLDSYLAEKNILMIIKPHPYQNDLELFRYSSDNIKVVKNDCLHSSKVNLYELVGNCDILLTDYSSIYFDFLLTQKPIGFVIDDIDSYGDKRGFVVENPLDYMPGEKICDLQGLKDFLEDIQQGKDKWQKQRKEINDLVNYDQNGDYCKKILDFVGISK